MCIEQLLCCQAMLSLDSLNTKPSLLGLPHPGNALCSLHAHKGGCQNRYCTRCAPSTTAGSSSSAATLGSRGTCSFPARRTVCAAGPAKPRALHGQRDCLAALHQVAEQAHRPGGAAPAHACAPAACNPLHRATLLLTWFFPNPIANSSSSLHRMLTLCCGAECLRKLSDHVICHHFSPSRHRRAGVAAKARRAQQGPARGCGSPQRPGS